MPTINDIGMIESFYCGMNEPGGFEPDNKPNICPECDGKGYYDDLSDCCTDRRDPDTGLCYNCHDHSDPAICIECNGKGKI